MSSYDEALIKQIVKRGGRDVVSNVVNALHPGAPSTAATIAVAKVLLETMFDEGKFDCPRCGADPMDAEWKCYADASCPVAADATEMEICRKLGTEEGA